MTIAIAWEPSNKNPLQRLDVTTPSFFLDTMERAGFHLPCTIDLDDRPIFVGMAAVFARRCTSDPNPFKQIVDLLDLHDSIDLEIVA